MAAPNETCETALVITTLPYSDTPQDMDSNTVYYKFTPVERGVFRFIVDVNNSQINIYNGLCASPNFLDYSYSHVDLADEENYQIDNPQVDWILLAGVEYTFEVNLYDRVGTFSCEQVAIYTDKYVAISSDYEHNYDRFWSPTRRRFDPFLETNEEIGNVLSDYFVNSACKDGNNYWLLVFDNPNSVYKLVKINAITRELITEFEIGNDLVLSTKANNLKLHPSGDLLVTAWKGTTLGGIDRWTSAGVFVTTYGEDVIFNIDDVVTHVNQHDIHLKFDSTQGSTPLGIAISPDGNTLYYGVYLNYQQVEDATGIDFHIGNFPQIRSWDIGTDIYIGLVKNYDIAPLDETFANHNFTGSDINLQYFDTLSSGNLLVCGKVNPSEEPLLGPLDPPDTPVTLNVTGTALGGWPTGTYLVTYVYFGYTAGFADPSLGTVGPTSYGPTASVSVVGTGGSAHTITVTIPNIPPGPNNNGTVVILVSNDGGANWGGFGVYSYPSEWGIPIDMPYAAWLSGGFRPDADKLNNIAIGYPTPIIRVEQITPAGELVSVYKSSYINISNRYVALAIREIENKILVLSNKNVSINAGFVEIFDLLTTSFIKYFPVLISNEISPYPVGLLILDIATPPIPGSGIYKLVPGKTHDTLYVDPSIPTTTNIKIP